MNENELAFLRTQVKQLRATLNRETPPLGALLRRRGFVVYKKDPTDRLLLPAGKYRTGYYRRLHKYSFRLFLRDVIHHQERFLPEDVARYSALPVAVEYIDYLRTLGLIKKKGDAYALSRPVRSFGETLEWYVAELFRREFGADAIWGAKFRRPAVGGDYDVVAKLGEALIYLEVKSSPPKQIYAEEISAFMDRVADLAPSVAVFFMDTELRMKDKLVPMFEAEFARRRKPLRVQRLERELFHIDDRLFIVNAKESVLRNIEIVLSRYYQKTLKMLMK